MYDIIKDYKRRNKGMETRVQRYGKKHGAKPFFKAFFVGVVRYFGWKVAREVFCLIEGTGGFGEG